MKEFFQKLKIDKNALILSLFAIIVIISVPVYDRITNNYLNQSLKQAAVTYAVTRSINAAVSIIQESSLTVGVGVEGNLALGQALDPINDATERFSDLLTFSLWSLGSEKIIYEISKLPAFTIIIIILAVLNIFYNSKLLKNTLLILIVLRIFMPFSATVSYYFNRYYFIPNITASVEKLKPYTKKTEKQKIQEENFWSKFSSSITNAKNSLIQIQEDAKYYISHATDIINALISLASLYLAQFLLNVIFLPLFLIYLIKNFKLE